VPPSTLLFAAQLVAARSVAKHAGLAEVDYTLRKYVRKPRKAAPGSVLISNQKTLRVESEK
jgi:predicted ribosome quality control (RQC) complex YloA/Tae2 family protein